MRKLVVILLMSAIWYTNAFAFDKTFNVSVDEIDDLVINQNGVKLNNFMLAEKQAFLADELVNINVSFSARNKNNYATHFSAMLVGLSEKDILWCLSVEPMMSTLSEKATETVEGSVYITPGLLSKTKKIWIRIVGDI
jgi:hypothetical protein